MTSRSVKIRSIALSGILLGCQSIQNPELKPTSLTRDDSAAAVDPVGPSARRIFVQAEDAGNRLAETSWPVTDFEHSLLNTQIQKMQQALKSSGKGIAASQVGFDSQIIIIRTDRIPEGEKPATWNHTREKIFINPVITRASSRFMESWQQCLSAIAHGVGRVKVWKWVQYTALDEKGLPVQGILDGEAAITFQHAFRHLLGGTILDKTKEFITVDEFLRLRESEGFRPYSPGPASGPHLLDDYQPGETIREYAHRTGLLISQSPQP